MAANGLIRKWMLLFGTSMVLFTVVSCSDVSDPLPPLTVVNNSEDSLLLRFDIVLEDESSPGGFETLPLSESSVWKFSIDPDEEITLDISMNRRYPIDLTGTIRLASITAQDRVVLNESFTAQELRNLGWTLVLEP